jgi:hypothetical protein
MENPLSRILSGMKLSPESTQDIKGGPLFRSDGISDGVGRSGHCGIITLPSSRSSSTDSPNPGRPLTASELAFEKRLEDDHRRIQRQSFLRFHTRMSLLTVAQALLRAAIRLDT